MDDTRGRALRPARLDTSRERLAAASRAAAARGPVLDLTETNPTRVGLSYPHQAIAAALARAPFALYEPAPLGLPAARAAVAADYARAGVTVDPARLVLTASSSESYGFLFKLCCDPGDAVLVPEPSYPLFEYLARLEGVVPIGYRLAFDGVWHVDFASLDGRAGRARAATAGVRARSSSSTRTTRPDRSSSATSWRAWVRSCAREDLALISDEVFAPYPLRWARGRRGSPPPPSTPPSPTARRSSASAASRRPAACRSSSSAGSSPAAARPPARIAALELVADTYLSVATPVQAALADLLALGAEVRAAIAGARRRQPRAPGGRAAARLGDHARCRPRGAGRRSCACPPAAATRPGPRRWSPRPASSCSPATSSTSRGGTFLVVSLLPAADLFAEAIARLVAHVDAVLR